MLCDSHCHIDRIPSYRANKEGAERFETAQAVIDDGLNSDLEKMLCVSVELERFDEVHQLALDNPAVHCSVGVHPTHQDCIEPTVEQLVQMVQQDKVVAIGETGLDYFHIKADEADWQRDRFRTHIQAAIEAQKPLILHNRESKHDLLEILKEQDAQKAGGVMHCFVEDLATAEAAMAMNFYISFSGVVTYNSAKDLQEVAKQIPDDRLLIETDSPWLAPTPHRGETNYPKYVKFVAQKLAELRGQSVEHIAKISHENFHRLFLSQ